MKMTKRFFAFLMAVAMCMAMMSMPAFAAENPQNGEISIPEDAVILYEENGIIFYHSNQQEAGGFDPYSTRSGEMTYNSVLLTKDYSDSFKVTNPNPGGAIYGTLRVECDNTSANSQIIVSCGNHIRGGYVYAAPAHNDKKDVYFYIPDTTKANTEVLVRYFAVGGSSSKPMRINCWVYVDKPDIGDHQYWDN